MTDPDRFDELDTVIRDAIKTHKLCLGSARHRRFYYEPPVGWQPLARGQVTEFYPLDFPRHSAHHRPPGFAKRASPPVMETLLYRRVVGLKRSAKPVIEPVMFNGLKGVITYTTGASTDPELKATDIISVAFEDRLTYLLRLDTTQKTLEEDRSVFFNTLKSINGVSLGAQESRSEVMSSIVD